MDVVMPQMGESIAQGTITKWLKGPGDTVDKDETLFEIATDKVDAEIPSPAAGTLGEILIAEGATVDVGTIVAKLDTGDGDAGSSAASAGGGDKAGKPHFSAPEAAPAAVPPPSKSNGAGAGAVATSHAPAAPPSDGSLFPASAKGIDSKDDLRRLRSTPVVRKIAEEHGVRLADVRGSGMSGRVTKKDILAFIEGGGASRPAVSGSPMGGGVALEGAGIWAFNPALNPLGPSPYPTHSASDAVTIEPMSGMRKAIAKHMVASQAFSAHVEQTIEVDFTAIDKVRGRLKAKYAERGIKLTYTAFILAAVARALREFPQFNVSVDGENLIRKHDVNVGMAVALDWGLLVPVIKRADEMSLSGIARASNDLAERARAKKLKPEEVQGGTFTVTNPGGFGVLSGNPIINQPEVSILGCGVIEKRAVVVDDAIAIRKRSYFTLTIDHRVLDGADGARFLKYIKDTMEAGDFGE